MARKKDESLFLRAGRGLVGLGKELARPAVDYSAFIGEAIVSPFKSAQAFSGASRAEAQANQAMKLALGKPTEAKMKGLRGLDQDVRKSVQQVNSSVQPTFMTSPERRKAYSRISGNLPQSLSYGLQKTAGAASYLVPAGKSFKAASALGALGGGAVGFSQDADTFQEALGNVAGGALAGGITGGAMYSVGSGLSKLAGRGAGAADDVATKSKYPVDLKGKKALDSDPFYAENLPRMQSVADDIGISRTKSPMENVRVSLEGWKKLQSQKNKIIDASDAVLNTDDIIRSLDDKIVDKVDFDFETPGNRRFLEKLYLKIKETGGDPRKINALKSEARKAAFGSKSIKNDVQRELFGVLTDSLDTIDDSLSSMSQRQKIIYDIAQELADAAKVDNPLRAEIPFISPGRFGSTGIGVDLPITAGKAGTIIPRIGESVERLGSRISGGAQVAAGAAAPIASSPYAQYGARQLAVSDTFRERPAQIEQGAEAAAPTGGQGSSEGIQIKTAADLYAGRATRNDFVVTPDGKRIWNPYSQSFMPYDAKAFGAAGVSGEMEKLTEKQRSFLGAGSLASDALEIVQTSNDINVGPIAGRVSRVGEYLGSEDPSQTILKSKIATARTAARNALLGANMSDAELESYLDATFDIRLPRNILEQRLKAFVQDMQTLANPSYAGGR